MQQKHIHKPFTRTQLEHILNHTNKGREARLARQLLDLMIHVANTRGVSDMNKELEAEKTCTWTRTCLNYSGFEPDAWSTSCGEDFAIVEEWDDTPSKFCGNCGGKTQQALEKGDVND